MPAPTISALTPAPNRLDPNFATVADAFLNGFPTLRAEINAFANYLNTTALVSYAFSDGTAGQPSLRFASDSNTGIFRSASDTLGFSTAGAERLRIDSDGLVGIGLANPSAGLDILTGINRGLKVMRTKVSPSNDTYTFEVDSSAQTANVSAAGAMKVTTSVGNSLVVDGLGRVGLGTASPSGVLEVNVGSSAAYFTRSAGNVTESPTASIVADSTAVRLGATGDSMRFQVGPLGTTPVGQPERMRITSAGRVGIGTSSPRAKLEVSSGTVRAGDVNATTGGLALEGEYNGDNVLLNLGSMYSSGAAMLGYGVRSSKTANDTFLSTASNAAFARGALVVGRTLQFFNGAGQTTPIGDVASMEERFRIAETGNVGIGTKSCQDRMTVEDNHVTDVAMGIYNSAGYDNGSPQGASLKLGKTQGDSRQTMATISAYPQSRTSSTQGLLVTYVRDSSSMREVMRHYSDGSMTMGKTNVGSSGRGMYYVNGQIGITNPDGAAMAVRRDNNGIAMSFLYGGSGVGSINLTAAGTDYTTASDHRLKEDYQDILSPAERLMQLSPVNVSWKADGTRSDTFIAHELAEVLPYAVTGEKDAVDPDGNPEYQSVDYSKVVPLLTAALQEALTKIENLETRINAMEAQA